MMPVIKTVNGITYLVYNNEYEAVRALAESEPIRSATTRFASFGAMHNALELGNLKSFPKPLGVD